MKVYFAHPKLFYRSDLEKSWVAWLAEHCQGAEVINPSDEAHQQACGRDITQWQALAAACDVVAVLPFADGAIGAGAHAEACKALETGREVWLLSRHPWNDPPHQKISSFEGVCVLSVEETRQRNQQAAQLGSVGRKKPGV